MHQQFRETTIAVFGQTQVIRTERKTTITMLERTHTKAVREALIAAYAAVPDAKKAALKERLEKRAAELDEKVGFDILNWTPEQKAMWQEVADLRELARIVGKHKFTPAKSNYVDGKPVPVRYTEKIPESVQAYHEYVQDALV